MRFHIGFSKRISWKWIIGAIGIIAAFFFGNHVALAASSGSVNMTPTRVRVYDSSDSSWQNQTMTFRSSSVTPVFGDNYYTSYSPSSNGGVQHGPIFGGMVEWFMPAKDLCSNAGVINYQFKYFVRPQSSYGELFPSNGFGVIGLTDNIAWKLISRNLSSSNLYVVNMQVPNDTAFKLRFYFDAEITNAYYYSSAVSYSWNYSCEYSLSESTTDIINNNNQNTQQIIDSQQDINDSINNDNVQSGTSHGGNFFNNTTLPDHGLSSIVTLPINLLQGILNSSSSCNDFIFFDTNDLFGLGTQIITLPSGCILWSHASSSIQLVYHSLLLGIFGYWVLVDIWRTVNAVLDPERKNDYVMDL